MFPNFPQMPGIVKAPRPDITKRAPPLPEAAPMKSPHNVAEMMLALAALHELIAKQRADAEAQYEVLAGEIEKLWATVEELTAAKDLAADDLAADELTPTEPANG